MLLRHSRSGCSFIRRAVQKYYGFHFVFPSPTTRDQVNEDNIDTVSPDFGTTPGAGNIELQVQLPTRPTRHIKSGTSPPPAGALAQGAKKNGDWINTNKLVDPEYIALDPRTLRFGVWGTDASSQGTGNAKKDASYGAEDSVDQAPQRTESNRSPGPSLKGHLSPSAPCPLTYPFMRRMELPATITLTSTAFSVAAIGPRTQMDND